MWVAAGRSYWWPSWWLMIGPPLYCRPLKGFWVLSCFCVLRKEKGFWTIKLARHVTNVKYFTTIEFCIINMRKMYQFRTIGIRCKRKQWHMLSTNWYSFPDLTVPDHSTKRTRKSVADPGFPVGGGVDLVVGAVDPRGGYVSKILHVKTKESGSVGGGACRARPPISANGNGTP